MKKINPTLTIITPTYNRKELLKRCFESLLKQSVLDFEWIVVDDGSIDGTKEEFPILLEERLPFTVQYIWKENGGKHTALNESHLYINGKYVLLLDSDDMLTENAVEIVLEGWKEYDSNADIGIVTFLRKLPDGTIFAKAELEHVPLDVLNHKRICTVGNDCCEVIRTELFKQYPFPVFEGERFLAETALWYRVGLEVKCVYIHRAIYMCDYLEGGLTKSGKKLRIRNCQGGMYTSYLRMNRRCSLKGRIKAGLLYVCYGHFSKVSVVNMIKEAKGCKVLAGVCVIPGTLLYYYWKRKYQV